MRRGEHRSRPPRFAGMASPSSGSSNIRRAAIADWVETQKSHFVPSSLDRFLSQPDSPMQQPSSSSGSASYARGEVIAVRCNQRKWLLGEVRRVCPTGVRVWVGEAGLLVNVPTKLVTTHLVRLSVNGSFTSLPPASESMLDAALHDPEQQHHNSRLLLSCVRPAHLSHRRLYVTVGGGSCDEGDSDADGGASREADACAICQGAVLLEDEAVAPWDCEHSCHIDCIQDRPRFFSTTSCPTCASSHSPVRHQSNTSSPPPALHTIHEEQQRPPLKPALKTASPTTPPPPPQSPPSTASASLSLAERMKQLSLPAVPPAAFAVQPQQQWVTVIKDGQNTRQTPGQQRFEHMAKAKENTFSAKAAKMQQQLKQ